jgi:hypothetical protein
METVTIEREGYKVEGEVYGVSGSPYGLRPSREVGRIEPWIHDPETFRKEHGMEPTEDNLEIVVKKEEDAICDDLIDAAGEA